MIRCRRRWTLRELLLALKDVMHRAELFGHHAIRREALSVRQRMGELLWRLESDSFHRFETPVRPERGPSGHRGELPGHAGAGQGKLVEIMQEQPLAPIYLKARVASHETPSDIGDEQEVPGESAWIEPSAT